MNHSKLILSGEHSVVYGYPAIVASTSLLVQTSISHLDTNSLVLVSQNFETEKRYTKEDLNDFLNYSRSQFKLYRKTKDVSYLKTIRKTDSLAVLTLASALFLEAYPQTELGLKLSLNSNVPVGSGMGSSATIASSVLKALAQDKHIHIKPDKLSALIYQVEEFIHGNPSGVDNTAVVYGGLLQFKKVKQKISFSQIETDTKLPASLLIQTGIPKESTADMVGLVAEKKRQDKQVDRLLKKMGELTESFVEAIKKNEPLDVLVQKNQQYLEKLGVVGTKAQKIVRQIEDSGGVAKICGAGGVRKGSGILWAFHPDPSRLTDLAVSNNWKYWQVRLGE